MEAVDVSTLALPLSCLLEVTQPEVRPETVIDGASKKSIDFEAVAKSIDDYWSANGEALTKTALQAASMVKIESLSIYNYVTGLSPEHDPQEYMGAAQSRRNEIVKVQNEVKAVFVVLGSIALELEAVRTMLQRTEAEQAKIADSRLAGADIQSTARKHKETAITWIQKIDSHARQARAAEAAMFNAIGSANTQLATLATCLDTNEGVAVSSATLLWHYGTSKTADVKPHVFPQAAAEREVSRSVASPVGDFVFSEVSVSSGEDKTKLSDPPPDTRPRSPTAEE